MWDILFIKVIPLWLPENKLRFPGDLGENNCGYVCPRLSISDLMAWMSVE
jgi:hypothetical protein